MEAITGLLAGIVIFGTITAFLFVAFFGLNNNNK